MPVDTINKALPALPDSLNRLPALNNLEAIWDMLRRLLAAHAPSGGANLLPTKVLMCPCFAKNVSAFSSAFLLMNKYRPYFSKNGRPN